MINNQYIDKDKLNKSVMANEKTVEENLVALIAKLIEKITIGKTHNWKFKCKILSINIQLLG